MDENNRKHSDQFNAALPLPDDSQKTDDDQANPAADLVRKKVEAAYAHEPDADEEIEEVEALSPKTRRSRHQEFIYNLTNSGRPLHEINAAWHEYYAGLSDSQKTEVWQEFYNSHSQSARHPAVAHYESKPEPINSLKHRVQSRVVRHTVNKPPVHTQKAEPRTAARPHHRPKTANPLHSLMFGVAVGSITILIFLFGFFNERIIAPFIQPSRNITNLPAIITNPGANPNVSGAPEIIIPKINIEVPVVYGVTSTDDPVIQKALEVGVVHYADTALPGQDGNLVIVGHSSGNIFNKGQYKYVFSLLREMDDGDTFYLQKDSKLYTYQIYKKEIVKPTDVGVLAAQSESPATATLITCDPPGVSSNRLVVVGKQISPDPAVNVQLASTSQAATTKTAIIPSDSPTLWSRLTNWFIR
jgi:sortase A